MNDSDKVLGVYSHSTKYEYRTGENESQYRNGTFWFVCEQDDDTFEVRPLDGRHIPGRVRKTISRAEFLKDYTPELQYYQDKQLPFLESLQEKVRMGRRFFSFEHLDSQEQAFCEAVLESPEKVDEDGGLKQVYADQQRYTQLRMILDKLLNVDADFREEQRHKFNEFGINLRKGEQFNDAIRYYSKALEVNEDDENLHFNIARAYYGVGKNEQCRKHLNRALQLHPEMREAKGFLRALDREESGDSRPHNRRRSSLDSKPIKLDV
ncbi:Tetratricopeptide TPR_1 repeat-containing protein [Pseudodesulfovibrio profundus]|uniref:Tetratricopeptide TPR_1 repeat-containing protein n=1 Tax=Pseudodesulfovibrio profundus TaxID=57320 RepID=A0A2C8F7M7_9BACT|nr:tetratricopeptide repeat protein [Pseudodesulfovibrio profundus]SOB58758.1 Tetratricopeptide TPR_1 repeat-containing protein [Pseudodesulfovibrio profundus]